jgi:phytoene dehydrogenase-like protein
MCAASAQSAEYDIVVVGSGLGGLSAAALLAVYGNTVLVCEAHTIPGGCAHSFERAGYTFDSGPSLWSGCAKPSTNPIRQVLDAIGESPEWVGYGGWMMYTEEGAFEAKSGDMAAWRDTLAHRGNGAETVEQWDRLIAFIEPLQRAVLAIPPLALRADAGALLTAGPYLGAMADPRIGLRANLLDGPFSAVMEAARVDDPFLVHWFDFLAFAFSGLPANGTVAAAMVYMLADLHRDGAQMDYPLGGSGAVVDALVRGLERYGGKLRLRSRVDEVLVDESGSRCTGVRLASGEVVRARKAVVSNAPVWQTASLLPPAVRQRVRADAVPADFALNPETPPTPSFMHLHLGIRAEGLSEQALASIHHIVIPEWSKLTAPQSAAFVSIPSLLDPSLAPDGRHVIHAYLPATEPYDVWEHVERGTAQYDALKAERAAPLYAAIERIVPDLRERIELEMVGSPLTHERFLRRHRGTYGPELPAGQASFPGARTALDGLLCCGDSTWPGIGVPAVAGSGIAAAHAVAGVGVQRELLRRMRAEGTLVPA